METQTNTKSRYENGVGFVTFEVVESSIKYSWGVIGFNAQESMIIPSHKLIETVEGLTRTGYRRIDSIDDIPLSETNKSKDGFLDWLGGITR